MYGDLKENKMKTKRNLSGIYFREKNDDGHYDNIVFEDLSEQQQNEKMKDKSEEWLKSLAKYLANTLNKIGEQFDIMSGNEKKEGE